MTPQKEPKPLEHSAVDSSTIKTVGYDEEKQELHVAFHGSGTYVYQNVPKHLYEAFMISGSKGKFLHQNIRGRYEHGKI